MSKNVGRDVRVTIVIACVTFVTTSTCVCPIALDKFKECILLVIEMHVLIMEGMGKSCGFLFIPSQLGEYNWSTGENTSYAPNIYAFIWLFLCIFISFLI